MSPDVPGLVLTSTNLGVVATLDEVIEVTAATRSAVEAGKRALARRVAMACAMAGFSTREEGGYPGWRPVPGTALLRTIDEVWRGLGHGPMEIMAIHAGLECGLIGERYPQMEMVSFGPDMWDAHTPDERVSIASVGAFYALLRAVVERLAQPVA
jgi:dipeptidase D